MRIVARACLGLVLFHAAVASAQTAPMAPPLPPLTTKVALMFRSEDARDSFLWNTRSDYRWALGWQRVAMVVAVAGGATAAFAGLAYFAARFGCALGDAIGDAFGVAFDDYVSGVSGTTVSGGDGHVAGTRPSSASSTTAGDQQCTVPTTGVTIAASIGLGSMVAGIIGAIVAHSRVNRIRGEYVVGFDVPRGGGAVAQLAVRF